jgi:hypothetical protein
MSLPANPRRDRYVANAGQTVFPYTFRIFAASDLVVERLRGTTTTTLQLNVDYTVSGVGNNTGGNVTLTQGAEQNDIIAIVSNQPNQRSTDFTESGDLRAAALNAEFDRIWIGIQQIAQDVSRQITRPLSDPTASYVLPAAAVRANKYLAFAADGSLTYPVAQPAGPNAAEAYWWGGTAGGTANALTLSIGGAPGSYAAGQRYAFVVASNNTGAATLNVNGLAAVSIRRPDGSTLAAGDLVAGNLVAVTYDGTNFRLAWSWTPPPNTAFTTDVSVSKTDPALILNKAASGQVARVFGRTNGSNRWAVELGDTTAEGGGNAGSDLVVRRYDNSGAVLGAPVIINRASGAVTLEAPLTLPASNPTDPNHAARKAYVDAGDVWTKLVDVAVSNSTTIDITGFSLQDYRMVHMLLLGARLSSSNSNNLAAQAYRGGALVNTGYTFVRDNASGSTVSCATSNNQAQLPITLPVDGINTDPVMIVVNLAQPASDASVAVGVQAIYRSSSPIPINYRVSCHILSGTGWVDGIRITAPVAFQNNVGRIVVLGLKP